MNAVSFRRFFQKIVLFGGAWLTLHALSPLGDGVRADSSEPQDRAGQSPLVADSSSTVERIILSGVNTALADYFHHQSPPLPAPERSEIVRETDPNGESALEEPASAKPVETLRTASPATEPRYSLTPLQLAPSRLVNLETANILPAGSLSLGLGARIFPRGETGAGTGLQVYNASIGGGVSDRLQLGLDVTFFDDRLGESFVGGVPYLGFLVFAPQFKYRFLQEENYSLAVSGSLEIGKFTGSDRLYTPDHLQHTSTTVGGTLQVPFTYNLSPNLQWHAVPGLVFWPGSINNGGDFYGTFLNFGTGLNFTPIERLTLFADLNLPITSGNAVNTRGEIIQEPVWSAGLTYLHSPTVALDLYATNSFGSTPATRVLAFVPDGDQIAVGINLKYTPDLGQNYPTGFRKTNAPLTFRDRQLLFNGVTVTGGETLNTGMVSFQGGTGPGFNFQLTYGLSDDAQLAVVGQQLADNETPIDNSFKIGAYSKLRFLSQRNGDPFSLSAIASFEQSTVETGGGLVTGELAFLYQITPGLAVMFNPKAGFFGDDSLIGLGFGVNYDVWEGIQLIGEVTPVLSGDTRNTVWSAGIRYLHPVWNVGIDLYGTNAAGTYGIGGLIGRSDQASVGFNLLWLFGGK